MALWCGIGAVYGKSIFGNGFITTNQGQHRIMEQVLSPKDFVPRESVEKAGILDVFPFFYTAKLGQKIRRKPLSPLCGVALRSCCLRVRNGSVLFCVFMLLTPFKRGASVGFSEPSDKKADTGKTALDCDFCNT